MLTDAEYKKWTVTKNATGALFCLALALITGFAAYQRHTERNWPEVTGTVRNSRIKTEMRHTKHGNYEVHTLFLNCLYTVDGAEHKAELLEEEDRSLASIQQKSEDKYHPGSRIKIHYNPVEASQCALDPAPGKDSLPTLVTCTGLFVLMSILSLLQIKPQGARPF